MRFESDFLDFLEPGADRLACLSAILARRGLEGKVLSIGERRHLLVRLRPGKPGTILVAHYDRVEGSPGALDNSAACLVLANAAKRISADASISCGSFVLFTDGEEAPASGPPSSQGAYALARGLGKAFGSAHPAIYVFDVIGRGKRLLLSTASREAGRGGLASALLDEMEARAFAASASMGLGVPARFPLPWSDDLGFTLAGLPALAISLLPEEEALRLAKGLARRPDRQRSRPLSRAETPGEWPETWKVLHGADDDISLVEEGALAAMEEFCVRLCRTCGPKASPL